MKGLYAVYSKYKITKMQFCFKNCVFVEGKEPYAIP